MTRTDEQERNTMFIAWIMLCSAVVGQFTPGMTLNDVALSQAAIFAIGGVVHVVKAWRGDQPQMEKRK